MFLHLLDVLFHPLTVHQWNSLKQAAEKNKQTNISGSRSLNLCSKALLMARKCRLCLITLFTVAYLSQIVPDFKSWIKFELHCCSKFKNKKHIPKCCCCDASTRLTSTPKPPQLEESNRTLTVDVANLASEKEELNNQLKEMQQREFLA